MLAAVRACVSPCVRPLAGRNLVATQPHFNGIFHAAGLAHRDKLTGSAPPCSSQQSRMRQYLYGGGVSPIFYLVFVFVPFFMQFSSAFTSYDLQTPGLSHVYQHNRNVVMVVERNYHGHSNHKRHWDHHFPGPD